MAGERRYLGIAEEGTFGTATAAVAFIDYLDSSLAAPSEPVVFYEGAGSRGFQVAVPGPYIPSGDLQMGVDPMNFVHFLKWALGRYGLVGTVNTPPETTLDGAAASGDTMVTVDDGTDFAVDDYIQIDGGILGDVGKVTAINAELITLDQPLLHAHFDGADVKRVTSPFTHIFAPNNESTLPSFTARIGKDVFEHVFEGATVDRLSFSVDRGFLTCSVSVQARKDSSVTLNAGSKSFNRDIYTFRHGTTFIAGVDETAAVEGFSLEIANNLDAEGGVRMGSRFPREFPVQGLDVSGSLSLAFDSADEYARFWGASGGPSEDGADTFKLEQVFNSGVNWLKFALESVYWTQVSTPVSGRGRITQGVEFRAMENPVWGAINIEAVNTKDRY